MLVNIYIYINETVLFLKFRLQVFFLSLSLSFYIFIVNYYLFFTYFHNNNSINRTMKTMKQKKFFKKKNQEFIYFSIFKIRDEEEEKRE